MTTLFSRLLRTQRRARSRGQMYLTRRFAHNRAKKIHADILSRIDIQEFNSRFIDADSKYVDINKWLYECVLRFLSYRLDKISERSEFLDLGCGSGYFLLTCRHFGHGITGMDLDNDTFFNEVVPYFDIPRTVHCIESFQPLPMHDRKFDYVTAFMTCFNKREDGSPWGADEWRYFIDDLGRQMSPGGRLIVKFNRNHRIGRPFPPTLPAALESDSQQDVLFFADTMTVTY